MPAAPRMKQSFSAPARVNLLGEHTDYTGGLVLPMAIPFRTVATIAPRNDGQYSFSSASYETERQFPLSDRSEGTGDWSDYPVGVLRQLQQRGIEPPAFSLHLEGNVPLGAGLSSSASVEVASGVAMLSFSDRQLKPEELALLCQRAENDYVHSPCGIMDQFVITAAKKGHALLIDTRSLKYEHIPLNQGALADTVVVVCNSMVKHSVATGDYGDRRKELEAGQAVLLREYPALRDLGDATLAQLQSCETKMPHTSFLRCRHVVTENQRVRDAVVAMRAGDPERFGHLMLEAHESMSNDFASSCDEIDFLVETAAELPGCYGARITGGGFGGCTVNLVLQTEAKGFAQRLESAYRERFGVEAESYICEAVDGAILANAAAEASA